jgi:hypothetical protein
MPKGVPNKKNESASTAELTSHELIFLQSIREFFPALRLHSDNVLTSKIGRDKLAEAALEFHALMEFGAGKLKKNEQLALANQLWKALSSYMKELRIPITLNTVLNNLGSLEHAVEQCYPGYISSKLLKYTIMARQDNA